MSKQQRKKYFKAYYEANKDKIAKQSKAYYEKNKDKIAKQFKAYYEKKNKEFVKIPCPIGNKEVEYVYADGVAEELQKKIPKITQKIMLKLLKGGYQNDKY